MSNKDQIEKIEKIKAELSKQGLLNSNNIAQVLDIIKFFNVSIAVAVELVYWHNKG